MHSFRLQFNEKWQQSGQRPNFSSIRGALTNQLEMTKKKIEMNKGYKNVCYRKKYIRSKYVERYLMSLKINQIQTKTKICYFHMFTKVVSTPLTCWGMEKHPFYKLLIEYISG